MSKLIQFSDNTTILFNKVYLSFKTINDMYNDCTNNEILYLDLTKEEFEIITSNTLLYENLINKDNIIRILDRTLYLYNEKLINYFIDIFIINFDNMIYTLNNNLFEIILNNCPLEKINYNILTNYKLKIYTIKMKQLNKICKIKCNNIKCDNIILFNTKDEYNMCLDELDFLNILEGDNLSELSSNIITNNVKVEDYILNYVKYNQFKYFTCLHYVNDFKTCKNKHELNQICTLIKF